MVNEHFPNWVTSNVIIEKMIAPKLGGYLSFEGSHAKFLFLPENVETFVPPEDIGQFNARYGAFATWAFAELGLEQYFESVLYSAITPALPEAVGAEVRKRILDYDSAHRWPTFEGQFLRHMGVPISVCECAIEIEKDPDA